MPGLLRLTENSVSEFDAIYTAEDIGSYKPDLRNFEYMLRHLSDDFGFQKRDVLHVAQSLHHDHATSTKNGTGECLD